MSLRIHGTGVFLERHLMQFREDWFSCLTWGFVEPAVVFLAIGYGLGSWVGEMGGQVYPEFFFPGWLASTVAVVACLDAGYGVYRRVFVTQIYRYIETTPVSLTEVFWSEVVAAVLRTSLLVLLFLVSGWLLGVVLLSSFPYLFVLTVFGALWFAGLGIATVALFRSQEALVSLNGWVLVPMTFLSGAYFVMSHWSEVFLAFVYLWPLAHMVMLMQNVSVGGVSWNVLLSFLYLSLSGFFLLRFAQRRFAREVRHTREELCV